VYERDVGAFPFLRVYFGATTTTEGGVATKVVAKDNLEVFTREPTRFSHVLMALNDTMPGTPPLELRPETFLEVFQIWRIVVNDSIGDVVGWARDYHAIEITVSLELDLLHFLECYDMIRT
jgi:hypothetical protein